jgi:hypothetical protein
MARIEFPINGMYLGSDHLPGQKRPVLVIGVPGQETVLAHFKDEEARNFFDRFVISLSAKVGPDSDLFKALQAVTKEMTPEPERKLSALLGMRLQDHYKTIEDEFTANKLPIPAGAVERWDLEGGVPPEYQKSFCAALGLSFTKADLIIDGGVLVSKAAFIEMLNEVEDVRTQQKLVERYVKMIQGSIQAKCFTYRFDSERLLLRVCIEGVDFEAVPPETLHHFEAFFDPRTLVYDASDFSIRGAVAGRLYTCRLGV